MKNFFKAKGFGGQKGGKRFGGNTSSSRGFGGRDGGPAMMHRATCNECGDSCEVPFKPNGRKPVYCTNCFRRDEDGDTRRFGGNHFENTSRDEKRMFTADCDACGTTCEVPFKPNGRKPVYCRDCFGKSNPQGKGGGVDVQEQLAAINQKLDAILAALAGDGSEE